MTRLLFVLTLTGGLAITAASCVRLDPRAPSQVELAVRVGADTVALKVGTPSPFFVEPYYEASLTRTALLDGGTSLTISALAVVGSDASTAATFWSGVAGFVSGWISKLIL